MTGARDIPAGGFSAWLQRMRTALVERSGIEVPCGECTACCSSSHFIHIGRDEVQALARLPGELLFAAPGLPEGTMVLGYNEDGRCPMLVDGKCSIYEQRPLTCRTYDCRVFAAAGIAADHELIARRARRWKFSHPTAADRVEHAAVRAAARFVRERAACFPGGAAPDDPAQVAVLAVEVFDVFLGHGDAPGAGGRAASDAEVAKAVVEASERFAAPRGMTPS